MGWVLLLKRYRLRNRLFACLVFICCSSYSQAQVFCGIGMTFAIDTTAGLVYPRIEGFVPNSPAEKAGLKKGMFIKGVSGQSCENRPNNDILFMIKGDEGTTVDIYASEHKNERPQKYTVTRALITRESGELLSAFYTTCDSMLKDLQSHGYKIVSSYKAGCEDKDISFEEEAGKTYYAKVYMLEVFNFAGTEACYLTAELTDGKNTTGLVRQTAFKVSGFDINPMYLEASFQSKHKETLKLVSHKRENPVTCREAYVVIYSN